MLAQLILYAAWILAGLVGLYAGAELLVRGSVAAATRLGISRLAIGLTVVAAGTSAPEMFVSVVSAVQGHASLSVGNVVGSNIINVALVLGLLSLWVPISAPQLVRRFDIPVMLASYCILLFFVLYPAGFSAPGSISRVEGLLLLVLLIAYIAAAYHLRRERSPAADLAMPPVVPQSSYPWLLMYVVAGIALLGIGGELVVDGAIWYAEEVFGVSQRVAGLTIVAFATSLPELVTSLAALRKQEGDISLGNIIGSNIFNSFGVLGLAATVRPLAEIETGFEADIIMMFLSSLLLWGFLSRSKGLRRPGGIIMLVMLAVYVRWWLL